MNLKKEMVIIDNEIVTDKILFCKQNQEKKVYYVKYNNNSKLYAFFANRVKYLKNPKLLEVNGFKIYYKNKLLNNIKEIYEFNYNSLLYYYIIFNNDVGKSINGNELVKININNFNVIEYMKDISKIISLDGIDGKKLLYEQLKKIEVSNLTSSLANYLHLSSDLSKSSNVNVLIFPFGCNSSQYEAVSNAIYNRTSVIEGPPGTGKTQTILNIIANIIIRGMNCQVVSNNNAAIENIDEKLKKYNLDFIEALLGKKENKDLFFQHQDDLLPDLNQYEKINIDYITQELKNNDTIIKEYYNTKKDLAKLVQYKKELELEYSYFKKMVEIQKINLVELKKYNSKKVKLLWNELMSIDKLSFIDKIKFIFLYKVGNFDFYNQSIDIIIKSIQNIVYINDLNELNKKIEEKELYIDNYKSVEEEYIKISMDYFKKYLSMKYKTKRKIYNQKDIWKDGKEFLKDYPVVLSTTYSSRNSFGNGLYFDYIIMDESSQIDVVTGTLALSSAKYAVIIGDEKQLPNVIPDVIAKKTEKVFKNYSINECYSYENNSFLSSVKKSITNVPCKMLLEHYRCHPKIINFCNKKFYNNNLVIMTNDDGEKDVIKVIRTNEGQHVRDKTSQRQVDIIDKIVKEIDGDIGIISPYNNQVDLISENIKDIEVSTVHKFQGREKDTIIISTVDDEITDFVSNANILNVAISRAKKHLYFIVTGNEIKNSNISDFIDYVYYNNMEIENSKIYSCFDLLYKQYELQRLNFYKKHKKILKYDSENIIYYLIKKIIEEYDDLEFHCHQSLNDLIYDKSLLSDEEKKYVSNHLTHIDFYIFKKIGQKPVLAIEVDGYNYHKAGTKQYNRDILKNSILNKYGVPILRLKTNGSEEEKKVRDLLDEILK